METELQIYLVRHGATEMNNDTDVSSDMIRGWKDVPLNEEGREMAAKTGKELRDAGIQVIVSSDLSRARETAMIIGSILGVKPSFSRSLRPWDLGNFTGTSTAKAIPKIKEFVEQPNVPIPGGESFDSFKNRAFRGIGDAIQRAGGRQLCIVSHHRVERLLKAWIAAGMPPDHSEIDLAVFTEKGEPPGKAEIISVSPAAIWGTQSSSMRVSIRDAIRSSDREKSPAEQP